MRMPEAIQAVDDLLGGPTSLFRMTRKGTGLYQFKITLQDVKPPVWRRIQTSAAYSFWDLHVAIQDAMGWKDVHLHEFRILEPKTSQLESIGIPDDGEFGDDTEIAPSWKRSIANYFSSSNPSAKYVYDFGDDWNHEIAFEELLPAAEAAGHPICLDGRGACPPEDCGGPNGYAEFLRAIKKPGSPRGSELLEWIGGSFDPHGFDLKDVVFDDPRARWAWAFSESALLGNDILAMQTSPRKPDRQGRIAFHVPLAQYEMILRNCIGLDAALLKQLELSAVKNGLVVLKLDVEELKMLGARMASAAKKSRRLDDRMMLALRAHFQTMESLIRRI